MLLMNHQLPILLIMLLILMIKKARITVARVLVFSCLLSSPAWAEIDLNKLSNNPQAQFEALSKDFLQLMSYQDSQPAVSKSGLIPLGFEVGVNVSGYQLDAEQSFKQVGIDAASVILPRVYGAVDIFSLGIGATMTKFDDASLLGMKAKYNLIDGSALLPALAVNVHHTILSGVDTLEASATGGGIGISKGFVLATLFANAGYTTGNFAASSTTFDFKDVTESGTYTTFGTRIHLPLMNFGVQVHQIIDNRSITFNFGVNF